MSPKDRKVFDSAPYSSPEQSNNSMGKCVSKQTSALSVASADLVTTTITGKYSGESDYTPIRTGHDHADSDGSDCGLNNEGQSESKKNSKRAAAPETRGTAMSFGFRKKLYTPKKKNSQIKDKDRETEAIEQQEKYHSATVISNPGIVKTDDLLTSDKNGNAGSESTSESELGRAIPQAVPSRRDANGGGFKSNRFGFRSTNIVRPASTGITPKLTDFQENVENNNIAEKRRSKSASGTHSTRSMASSRANDPQSNPYRSAVPKINFAPVASRPPHQQAQPGDKNSGQEKVNRPPSQYVVVNTGMHTNIIVKPTPQPAVSVSKFTLHTTSLPKPQYPVPISLSTARSGMDSKSAKQVVNNSRKGFFGPREVSADSGISSLDNTFDNSSTSPRRARSRPRNLEMVMSGRHKFDVKDLEDTISCDSVEPLALPKLPSAFESDIQTVPLSGLVRTNTILSREEASSNREENNNRKINRIHSDTESVDEEKLFRDRSTSEKELKQHPSLKEYTTSSKNSSPGSSRASWCNAGESLAIKDCSSLSLSSSDESKDINNEKPVNVVSEKDINSSTLTDKSSLLSSLVLTETVPKSLEEYKVEDKPPMLSHIAESKFAEMAAAVSDVLLDDETSPTDSLVSSTESEEAMMKKSKKKASEDVPEKDIDEISPELDLCSPLSPGTPTHASNSLSLSDVGRDFLIDDEIADQPALLFSDKGDGVDSAKLQHSQTDTPTLMDTGSNKSAAVSSSKVKHISQAAIEHLLRTPLSLRKASILNRAESLDTLSPCESIASDDLMMDFESHSSMDSIDRMSHSMRSRCESALQALDDTQLFSDLETKGSEMIKEWNSILRVHRTGRDSIIGARRVRTDLKTSENVFLSRSPRTASPAGARPKYNASRSPDKYPKPNNSQLPARATRLLNRSRLQQSTPGSQLSNTGSDSPRSGDSLPRKSSRASSLHFSNRDANSSSDDLVLHDKSFRNSMIQDVLYFKKQLLRLRRVLQDQDEENLMRTDTLNPFELNNGQFFVSTGLDSSHHSDDKDLGSLTSSTAEDPLQELADLRRQVVYLQGQVDDRDRTIRLQKNIIEKLEAEKQTVSVSTSISEKECINIATQTERVRPLSIGQEGLARSKPECTSFAVYFPATASTITSPKNQSSRRHTVISTTFTNLNHVPQPPRRASIGWEKLTYKPVKTTMIGEPLSNNTIERSNNKTPESVSVKATTKCNSVDFTQYHQKNPTRLTNGSQNQKFIELSKCHLSKRNNYDDLNAENHSHTVTIV